MVVYVIPFPFTVVMSYDETGETVALSTVEEVRNYVRQNEDQEIKRRKCVRQMLRALEGSLHFKLIDRGKRYLSIRP